MESDPDVLISLAAVVVLVFANGFFVAAEFALVTIRRTRVEELADQGNAAARSVRKALEDLDRYIAGTQVGITIASLALGWLGEPALATLVDGPLAWLLGAYATPAVVHTVAVVIAFTLITFLHVVLGELVPKSLALQKPEQTALAVARPMRAAVWLFRPLIWSLNGLGNLVLKLVGLHTASGHESVHSTTELEMLVRQSHAAGELDELERRLLSRTFRFSETTAGDVMVPRSEMTGLDATLPLLALLDRAATLRHTRLPVYEGTLDNIVGVVYLHDLFRLSRRPEAGPADLKAVLRTPLFVPETMHLDVLIDRFRKQRTQIAVAVDEYGGTAGLVTLEDVVEAVFGEFQDQNEPAEQPPIVKRPEGGYVVRGDTRLAELNDLLGWDVDDGEVDTIGGWIMTQLGRVPAVGDEIPTPSGPARVTQMDRHRVAEVCVGAP